MEKGLKDLLNKNNFNFKKAYGQNFLTDLTLLEKIVVDSGIGKGDTVLEIGCGAGALTKVLSNHAKTVYGYEIDKSLKPVLDDVLIDSDNVNITFNDIMKEKVCDIEKKLKDEYCIVANLPYYITTPIIMNFLENAKKMRSMTIMVQKEVADRLVATKGKSDYGAITVGINLRGSAKIIANVGREMFTPMPNVDSAVVKIEVENKFNDIDYEKVRNLVRIAFSSRRKMLINNLINGYKISRQTAENVLSESSLSLTVRGEELGAEEFVNLSKVIEKLC